jgi:ATP-binding protein involved in chromosome partitioning
MHDPQVNGNTAASAIEHPLVPEIRAALHRVDDPEIRRPITDLGMVDSIEVDDAGRVGVRILLTVAGCPLLDSL